MKDADNLKFTSLVQADLGHFDSIHSRLFWLFQPTILQRTCFRFPTESIAWFQISWFVSASQVYFILYSARMGKRNLEEEFQNGATESLKKNKKSKQNLDETLDETINEDEAESVPNGFPKTRRDLMELPYDDKLAFVSVIANPMANKKFGKKLFKLMRKAGKISRKTLLRIGLKDVQLRIRKGMLLCQFIILWFMTTFFVFRWTWLGCFCRWRNSSRDHVPFASSVRRKRHPVHLCAIPHWHFKRDWH